MFFFPLLAATAHSPARPTRAAFTLLAVTHAPPTLGVVTPPPGVPEPAAGRAEPVVVAARSTGLWIGVRGGVGYRTLALPADGLRHVFPFGSAALVVDETRPGGYSVGWTAADGTGPLPEGQWPYRATVAETMASAGRRTATAVTLVPTLASLPFRVTARALSAQGGPPGPPVTLVCQVVNRTTVFAQLPAGYGAATGQFQVTARPRGGTAPPSSWRIGGLAASVRNGKDDLPPIVTAQSGPVTIRAAAAESEDFSGNPGFSNRHPRRAFFPSLNADGHLWTGVPTIRFLLSAHNASRDHWGQDWMVRIIRVTPQWSASPVLPCDPGIMPLQIFPVYNPQMLPPGRAWVTHDWQVGVTHDWQVGVAYPGQQHWVRVEGEMIRFASRTETVTFHDADIVHDAAFGGDRLVWRHAETQTTPSGVSVSALNGRPGVPDTSGAPPGNSPWRFDYGNAELLLAWRLPPGLVSDERAPLDAEAEAMPPHATGLLKSEWDRSPFLLWNALALPGDGDAGAWQNGGTPLRLSVMSSVLPSLDLSRLPRRQGSFSVSPVPLPRHLDTVSFRITLRERQESHPFTLLVPVRPAFPPGWTPDVADSRSARLVPAAAGIPRPKPEL